MPRRGNLRAATNRQDNLLLEDDNERMFRGDQEA
jgi:hypothetical protein